MYCPTCGSLASAKLNYCKNCGAKLVKESKLEREKADDSAKSMLDNILTTLFLVVMFGLGILVGLVAVLLGNGVDHTTVGIIIGFYIAAVFGICYILLSQVPKLINAKLAPERETPESFPPPQLSAKTTGQLEEYREPVRSVTEHTTRTLDKVEL